MNEYKFICPIYKIHMPINLEPILEGNGRYRWKCNESLKKDGAFDECKICKEVSPMFDHNDNIIPDTQIAKEKEIWK